MPAAVLPRVDDPYVADAEVKIVVETVLHGGY